MNLFGNTVFFIVDYSFMSGTSISIHSIIIFQFKKKITISAPSFNNELSGKTLKDSGQVTQGKALIDCQASLFREGIQTVYKGAWETSVSKKGRWQIGQH